MSSNRQDVTLKARVGRLKVQVKRLKAQVRKLKAQVEVIKPQVTYLRVTKDFELCFFILVLLLGNMALKNLYEITILPSYFSGWETWKH